MAATAQVIETGEVLRDRRLALGLSQVALGILADCETGTVQRWESMPRAKRVARALERIDAALTELENEDA